MSRRVTSAFLGPPKRLYHYSAAQKIQPTDQASATYWSDFWLVLTIATFAKQRPLRVYHHGGSQTPPRLRFPYSELAAGQKSSPAPFASLDTTDAGVGGDLRDLAITRLTLRCFFHANVCRTQSSRGTSQHLRASIVADPRQ